MDDYLFIVLAKLKADRLKLERERPVDKGSAVELPKSASPKARRSAAETSGELMWIVPNHGLRGWS